LTAERDPLDAIEDILRNLALAREFVGEAVTVEELEGDPQDGVIRRSGPRGRRGGH
jgi:regulator of RNase E activity RraA